MPRMSNGKLLATLSLILMVLLAYMTLLIWNTGSYAGLAIGIPLAPALIVLQIMLMIGLGMRRAKNVSEDRASGGREDSR